MLDPLPSAPAVYRRLPGDADRVYQALCAALVGRAVDWAAFSEADWRLLVYMADPRREGVGPALYWRFKDGGWPGEMPDGFRVRLKEMYYSTLAHNTLLLQELGRVLEALAGAGIPVIVLKGAALAVGVYEDIGLRPMGDLDLLVRPGDVNTAWAILEEIGYQVLSANTEIVLRKMNGQEIGIDLHWCLLSRFGLRLSAIEWFDVQPVRFHLPGSAVMASTFPLEPHLAYLAAHAYDQRLLRGFYDLNLILNRTDLNWSEIQAWIRRAGWEGIAPPMLWRAIQIFGNKQDIKALLPDNQPSPSPRSRSAVVAATWGYLDAALRFKILFRILFPTRRYLEWRYRRQIKYSWPYWLVVRWLDMLRDLFLTLRRPSIELVTL